MTSVELVRTAVLTDTSPYAYASVTPPGRLVFTAGACPLGDDGADHDAPSTLLGVAVLGYPDQLVEVEAVAVGRVPAAHSETAQNQEARTAPV
jgi:hypothetical protein